MTHPGSEIKLILLDFDGTLADTRRANTLAYVATLREAGYTLTEEEYAARYFGMRCDEFLTRIGIADPAERERLRLRKILLHLLLRKRGGIFDSAAAKAKAAAGCRQVLLDHRSAVLLWNLNRLGWRLCFCRRRLFLLPLRRDERLLRFLLLLFRLLRVRRLRKPLPQLFEGAVGHGIHRGKDSGIGCQAIP